MSSLALHDVVKHYSSGEETIRAVDGVCLEIAAGELVALYGPSGSGKTTLLLLAAGLIAPDGGRVTFGGSDIGALSSRESARYRLRDVGFVFQSFHLMPGASALDNALIKLPVCGYTVREAREKTAPWLKRLGLGERLEHRPEQLSMGERQRVAIARALVGEPRLLLADEPTGNLDTARTREILALLRDICHERRIPGLLVTHDGEAASFVDRTITLRDGRVMDGIDAELASLTT
ncbi:MAG TPA: ABC transporter ATP-binding protein [Solirubrobacteraceae bacterium]|jgi:putative ABC transport system ATP-binding protein|nr:ABC transporter ATP-binding protein [Solirubrobacteraceae bacterium]